MKKTILMVAMASLSLTTMADDNIRPGDDFFQYACGDWMKQHPLPAAYSRYGTFDQLQEDNDKRINAILTELLNGTYPQGSIEQKLSDLYKLAMDSERRNKEGVSPLMPLIDKLEKAGTCEEILQIQLSLAPYGELAFFDAQFAADEKNATQNILNISQGGLSLAQKEYYLDNDKATAAIREAFKKHIVKMFQLFGYSKKAATAKMRNVMKVETALAKVSKSKTELRDPEANYNKMSLSDFQKRYTHLPLTALMKAQGVEEKHIQEMIVGQPLFLDGADKLVSSITPDEYRDVIQWNLISGSANYLSDATVAESFDFNGRIRAGRKENYPLWKRSTNQVERVMGEALGKIYCEKYFPESAKQRMTKLVKNLQIALADRIVAQDWMNDSTKINALQKLNTFYVKVGYPDKWTDLSKLNIDPSKSYFDNMLECARFWNAWQIDHTVGKPVDIDDWYMTPQTVNAYYNPTTNEICFPAGILQPPFFDMQADDAFNYGAIGVVIGHEMTHGFDDQGRQYDKDGNMHDWWTASDKENFIARTDKYADFFSSINVLPDLKGNGRLTLGENLADHGGLQVAWAAYKNATRRQTLDADSVKAADQRFFHAYAGVWASNITEEEIRNRTKSDPHSLGRWRVNGALPHIDAWYDAFSVKEGDKMFIPKSERLQLW
ncbi:MAG: M13 family metallopeptidase [Prevotella sp.]|nr:M13 family metallopeptidase [Prevotella sp.]MBQ9237361.1 M13 family metallopeptidase [Prevotella sp.]